MKTGHIIIGIDEKVYFKYYKVPSPKKYLYDLYGFSNPTKAFKYAMKIYEASKRIVEINNIEIIYEWYDEINNPNEDEIYGYSFNLSEPDEKGNTATLIKDNQQCKAEIKNSKATIIELL